MDRQDRVTMDCRDQKGSNCTLTISGTEREVMDVAEFHAKSAHGMKDDPGLREQLRSSLKHDLLTR